MRFTSTLPHAPLPPINGKKFMVLQNHKRAAHAYQYAIVLLSWSINVQQDTVIWRGDSPGCGWTVFYGYGREQIQTMDIQEMRERFGDIKTETQKIMSTTGDTLSPEQTEKLDALLAEAEELRDKIAYAELRAQAHALGGDATQPLQPKIKPPQPQNYTTFAPKYQTRAGENVRVLSRGQNLVQYNSSGLTLGGFLRAAVGLDTSGKYRNSLTEGTDSTGGYTVPDIITGQVIDRLRAKSVLFQAGATTMVLPAGGEVSMAKLTGDPTAYWHQETGSVTASTPTFGRVTFQPRTLISLVKASRELLEDSINAEDALMMAFAESLATEVDRVGLIGVGATGEPLGILNTTGVGSLSKGVNGAALTNWDDYVNLIYELTQDNAMPPTAFIQNPRTTKEGAVLKDSQNQPLQKPAILAGIPVLDTTAVPINDTQGSATDASRVYAGYWPDLIWGVRHTLQIEVLREKYSETFEYGFQAHLRGDWVVRHPESFAVLAGVIPA